MPKKKRDKMKGENIGENLEQGATLGNGLKDAVPSKVLRALGPFCEQCMFPPTLTYYFKRKTKQNKNYENGLISEQCLDKLESTFYLIAL